ncbi:class F sortase [Candidatus Saccharibacteria bacterium]|nr:class F sortase [Candidatus Saccharibacteria bacterium]
MEGRARAKATNNVITTTEVDETDVTDNEKMEYTVAADMPRYLSIEKLGVTNARVLPIGVTSTNELDTPNNIFDVGWYINSAAPGTGGVSVIDGHNGGPTKVGVFKRLPSLVKGDKIVIEMGNGTKYEYEVYDNVSVPLDEADGQMYKMEQTPIAGRESISLITCTGEWSQVQQTYLSRQFLRAVRTQADGGPKA